MALKPPNPEYVLAIDPGERAGWASARIVDGDLRSVEQGVAPLKEFALLLGDRIADYDTVVYETWRLYADYAQKLVGNDMQPSQLVGIIRYLSWVNPSVRLVSLGATTKNTGRKVMPPEIKNRLQHSTEEHDKDALELLSFYWWDTYV